MSIHFGIGFVVKNFRLQTYGPVCAAVDDVEVVGASVCSESEFIAVAEDVVIFPAVADEINTTITTAHDVAAIIVYWDTLNGECE